VLTEKLGVRVLAIEILPLRKGDEMTIEFVRDDTTRRRGVLMTTKGVLEINSIRGSTMTLWHDTAPTKVLVVCRSTESGYLKMYNVWDRGKAKFQGSGMIKNQVSAGTYEYRCNDLPRDPSLEEFDRFVFRLTVGSDQTGPIAGVK
jgi:hypothetical protein